MRCRQHENHSITLAMGAQPPFEVRIINLIDFL
nr:MAG TPA: hypothetical protein [Bacteriophage sp.]